jgi:hypothetical protein
MGMMPGMGASNMAAPSGNTDQLLPPARARPGMSGLGAGASATGGGVFGSMMVGGGAGMSSHAAMGGSPNSSPVDTGFVGGLTDALNLTPAQQKLLDQALQDAQQEYRQLDEKRTTAQVGDAGELYIQIQAVDSRTKYRLEDRLWSRVDALLDDPDITKRNQDRTTARQYIRAELLFQFLGGANISIHRTGTFYTWRYTANGQANNGTGPKLPDFLQEYWTRYSKLLDSEAIDADGTDHEKKASKRQTSDNEFSPPATDQSPVTPGVNLPPQPGAEPEKQDTGKT